MIIAIPTGQFFKAVDKVAAKTGINPKSNAGKEALKIAVGMPMALAYGGAIAVALAFPLPAAAVGIAGLVAGAWIKHRSVDDAKVPDNS